jgi:hypothetical protein
MRVVILTLWTGNYAPLAEITSKNKKEYCDLHGYTFIEKTSDFKFEHTGFEKIYQALQLLKNNQCDLLFWCGTDTFITNYKTKITDLIDDEHDFFIATDANAINSDSFIIKNTPKAIELFQEIIDLYGKYIKHPWAEQQAIIELTHIIHDENFAPCIENCGKPKYADITKILPQHMINAYNYKMYPHHNFHGSADSITHYQQGQDFYGNRGQWQSGDFMIHWPAKTLSERIHLASEYNQYIIK